MFRVVLIGISTIFSDLFPGVAIPEKKHHAHVTFGGAHDDGSHDLKCLMGLRPGGGAIAGMAQRARGLAAAGSRAAGL